MARRHGREADENGHLIDRRSYLKLATAAGTLAGTGLVGSAAAQSESDADTSETVDLGEQGLSQGDVIDPYLKEHFTNGTEVRIPEGEYDWQGSGLGGPTADAALIGEGEVILNTVDSVFYNNVRAESGTIELRNFTVRGAVRNETRIRLETASDARIVVDNVNFPDGSVDDTGRAQALYVPPAHGGVIEIRNCYIAKFSDNGVYASPPGKGEGGQTIIDKCVAHNNNITGFRIGGMGSKVVNSVVINDATSPVPSGIAHNQRGIRIDESDYSKDLLIKNCDIIHSGSTSELGNGGPIRWSPRALQSEGHIENVRILNNVDIAAIAPRNGAAEGFTGNNIHVSGEGRHDVPDWFDNVTTGSEAQEPTPSLDDLPEGEDPFDGKELCIVSDGGDGFEYEFTATGEIRPQYYRSQWDANDDSLGEEATQNDDGTWTATGATAGGGGDTFLYQGSVIDLQATNLDDLTLYLDGTEVSRANLLGEETDGSSGDSSSDGSTSDGSGDSTDGSTSDGSTSDGSGDSTSDGSEPTELTVVTEGVTDVFEYQFTTSGEVTPLYERSEYDANDDSVGETATQNDDGTWTATGATGGSGRNGDSFEYHGDVLAFETSGEAETVEVYRDGTQVAVEDLVVDSADGSGDSSSDGSSSDGSTSDGSDSTDGANSLSNLLIVDGTASDDVTTYQFAVTGEIERDDALSTTPSDAMEVDGIQDTVGNAEVEGIVGKGVDGYRFSGSLVDFQFSGKATLTIEHASE